MTLIIHLSEDDAILKQVCGQIKKQLGCGGTVKEGHIELQGDHVDQVKAFLKRIEKVQGHLRERVRN